MKILGEACPDGDFGASRDFLEDGLIDSFDLIVIVSEIERSFGVVIDGEELLPENFRTLEAIETLVETSVAGSKL